MACTTILVGRRASYDGSTMIARNDDSGSGVFTAKRFTVIEPHEQERHYRSVLSHVEIELPECPLRYTAMPNGLLKDGIWAAAGVNSENVSMTATETITSNERVLSADPLVEYVPAGVDVKIPLQSYFRRTAPGAGQFEHTLIIVEKGAKVHFIEGCSAPKYNVANLHAGAVELFVGDEATLTYSTIENWSKNMYNMNTKRSVVGKNGTMNWVTGSFGSHTSCLYPMTILQGEGAHCEFTGVTFAGKGQFLDTGSKVVHNAPHTTSNIDSKSLSKSGGVCIYRGAAIINEKAEGAKSNVSCESLMLDEISQSDTIPAIIVKNDNIDLGHEAKIGRISDEAVYYLMSRGLSEEEARAMLVRGFVEPVSKALPLEYAVEMNNLINLELKGSLK